VSDKGPVVQVGNGVQLNTSSAPSLEEVAAAAGAVDMFLFRRIDPGRFAHIGGVGRGVGWAGIVELGVADEPFVAESLTTGVVIRRYLGEPWHVFGPYYGLAVVIVPVDNDLFAVFGSDDERLLRVTDAEFCELAGFASQSLTGVVAAKRLADELEVVNAVRELLRAPGRSFDEALQSIATQAATSLSCEVGVLYAREHGRVAVFDPTGVLTAKSGAIQSVMEGIAERGNMPNCIQDAATSELPPPFSTAEGLVSYYLLGFDEPVTAILLVAHTTAAPRGFTLLCQSLGLRLVEAAVPLLTTALSRDGLLADLERAAEQARRDTLTGLANRLAWDEAVAEVVRDGRPVSVVQLDCCSLKQTNDTLGHHTGDRLLRTVAHLITSSVREPDLVARVGGDEFAILLVDADETIAASVVDRIEQAVEDEPLIETVKIAVAVGTATTRVGDVAAAQQVADAHMLSHKRERARL
jgi:diguanylate cyclase (GGDEF)-like protein